MSFADQVSAQASLGAMRCERFRSLWHHIELEHVEPELIALSYKAVPNLPMRQLLTMRHFLDAFFEPEAAEQMLQLPNSYWFHSVFAQSLLTAAINGCCLETDRRNRISLAAYNLAVETLRLAASARFDLSLTLRRLSPAQVAARSIYGILVLSTKGSGREAEAELLVNLIFKID